MGQKELKFAIFMICATDAVWTLILTIMYIDSQRTMFRVWCDVYECGDRWPAADVFTAFMIEPTEKLFAFELVRGFANTASRAALSYNVDAYQRCG